MPGLDMILENKKIIVTGASSGFGYEIALSLARNGEKVLAIARREKELIELKSNVPENIFVSALDVCDEVSLEDSIANFVNEHGGIDGSVHSAGVLMFTPLKAFSQDAARKMMDVCFWAGVSLLQIATKKKYSNPNSSHVQIASVNSRRGQKGLGIYCAVKAAVSASVRSFAKELAAKGVRVNSISPGYIETSLSKDSEELLSPLGKGTAMDVADLVLFLLSDKSKWITGTDIVIDGGYLA